MVLALVQAVLSSDARQFKKIKKIKKMRSAPSFDVVLALVQAVLSSDARHSIKKN